MSGSNTQPRRTGVTSIFDSRTIAANHELGDDIFARARWRDAGTTNRFSDALCDTQHRRIDRG